jgi:hypothetical protein
MAGNLPLNLTQVTQTLFLKRFTVLHDRNFNLPQLLPAEKKCIGVRNKGMFGGAPCASSAHFNSMFRWSQSRFGSHHSVQ